MNDFDDRRGPPVMLLWILLILFFAGAFGCSSYPPTRTSLFPVADSTATETWYKNVEGTPYAEARVTADDVLTLYVDAIHISEHTFPPPSRHCITAATFVAIGARQLNGYNLYFATSSPLDSGYTVTGLDGFLNDDTTRLHGGLNVFVSTPCGPTVIEYTLELEPYVDTSEPDSSNINRNSTLIRGLRRYIP